MDKPFVNDPFVTDREKMVEQQIRARGIQNPSLLQAMSIVPRHLFIPETLHSRAYEDGPLPIEEGQTISQPYIVALMIDLAKLDRDCSVLEIGTGSGYSAAVLSQMVKEIHTIERISLLAKRAKLLLNTLHYENIEVLVGDGSLGMDLKDHFDAIIVTAGAPFVPESFIQQLKNGGRVIIPVGNSTIQQLLRLTKVAENAYDKEVIESVRFVPLIGQQGWKNS